MYKVFIDFINRADNLILTSHESPDGDAVCSELALLELLNHLGKEAQILNSDREEEKYAFLNTADYINIVEEKAHSIPPLYSLLVLDTHPFNIGKSGEMLRDNAQEIFIIDHHEDSYSDGYQGIHDSLASSTCQLIFQLMEYFDYTPTLNTAKALFTGIVYDTGSFQYKKTSKETFRIGGDLVGLGVDPFEVHKHLNQSNSKAFLVLQTNVMGTLTFYFNDHVAALEMNKEMLTISGARYEEAQPLINNPLICKDVEVAVLFKENEEGIKRCSIRSKGRFDCYELANKYGGGGHKTAAGFKIKGSFEEIRTKVLDEIGHFFP